jgi:hypothetical protein
MTELSSNNLCDAVIAAGVKYIPAKQIFYTDYPFKIEIRPMHKGKGLAGMSGIRQCRINIANPEKAREQLAQFNARMEKVLQNVEYRSEIRGFIENLDKFGFKTRMGGANNLFYLRDPKMVMAVVDRFHSVINSVTGPINDDHKDKIDTHNIIVRDKLYFNKFRYYIELEGSHDFVDNRAHAVLSYLKELPTGTWRTNRLEQIISYYSPVSATRRANRLRSWGLHKSHPGNITVYLSDPEIYVYLKMMGGSYMLSNHELVLVSELT